MVRSFSVWYDQLYDIYLELKGCDFGCSNIPPFKTLPKCQIWPPLRDLGTEF